MATAAAIALCVAEVAKLYKNKQPLAEHEIADISYCCSLGMNKWAIQYVVDAQRRRIRKITAVMKAFGSPAMTDHQAKAMNRELDRGASVDDIVQILRSVAAPAKKAAVIKKIGMKPA